MRIEDDRAIYPEPVLRLLSELTKMPGIGPRSAERISRHILAIDRTEAMALAGAIRDVKERVRPSASCFNLTETKVCRVCDDAARDRGLLCVVEQVRDLAALESVGTFRGLYHVLTGALSPLDGVGIEDLTLKPLVERVKSGAFREVIIATNTTLEGEGTALAVAASLKPLGVPLTRLATGVPAGSSLEHSNPNTLADALEGRRPVK